MAALFLAFVRRVTDLAAALAALVVLAALGLVVFAVTCRYLLNEPQAWIDELGGYLVVASVMLAAAEGLRRGEHIAVDILTDRLGSRGRRIVSFVGLVAVSLTAALMLAQGSDMVAFSRMTGLRSIGYLDIEMWQVQALVVVGGGLLLLAALGGLVRLAAGLPAEEEPRPEERSNASGAD